MKVYQVKIVQLFSVILKTNKAYWIRRVNLEVRFQESNMR